MSFTHVKGFKELGLALQSLPLKMGKNMMRASLRVGGNVFKEEAKLQLATNGSVKTGKLQAGLKVSTNYRNGVARSTVKTTGKHAYVAPWLEYGTAAHSIVPKKARVLSFGGFFAEAVDHPGSTPKPFMRPALDNRAVAALLAVGMDIQKRLTKQGLETPSISLEDDEE